MKLKIAQVIGLNTDQKAAQVISNSDEANSFFAVLILSSDDAFTKGRQMLGELSDFYFDFEDAPAGKLKSTFEEAQKKLAADFSILLASISGKVLYIISKGEVEVYLKRSDKLSPLLSVGAPSQLISGFLQEGDRLFLSTASLTHFLGYDLSKLLDLPIDTFEEEIAMRIGGSTNTEDQGLAALAVEIESTPEEADLEEVEMPNLQDESTYEQSEVATVKTDLMLKIRKALVRSLNFLWQKKRHFPKSNRGRLILAIMLIVIIGLGVGYKVKVSKDAQIQASFNKSLQSAKDDFNAAKGLASLSPADAKGKLDTARGNVNKALSLKPNNREAQDLKKQIEQDSDTILQQSSVSDFPLFLDMDLVKKNFRGSLMSLSNGKLLLLDPAVKTLVSIDLAKKSNQILAGSEQLGDATVASLNGGLAFVFSKDKGVLKTDITNQKLTIVSKKDSDFGEIRDIYGFGGNVYLLDSLKNIIWKYLPTPDGYSDKREYLNKGVKVDFGSVTRMQIESSVYVLGKDGQMLRFTRGDKDNFSYGGLDKGVKDPKSFFVSSDTDNLYLLDSGNSRLLILTKTGAYKGQITGKEFAESSDLVVDEKNKKVYLLDGSKIYSVDLK